MSRDEFFAVLFILACVNGLGSQIVHSVRLLGWADALLSTFGISVIVWIACFRGTRLILQERTDKIRSVDLALGFALLLLIALPIGRLSWLAITILSLYVLLFGDPSSSRRRGAVILLATTVPMLWSVLLFRYFANFILEIDASLIGWLLGTGNVGNVVRFADQSGSLRYSSLLFFLGQCLACSSSMGYHKPVAAASFVPERLVLVLSRCRLGRRHQRYTN